MSYDNSKSRYFSTVNRIRSSSRDNSLDNCVYYQMHHRYRSALDVRDEVKRINDIIDTMVADIDRKVDDIDVKVDAYLDDVFSDDNDGEKMSKKGKGKKKKKEKKDGSKVDDFGRRMHKLYYDTTKPVVKTYDGKKHDDENDVKDIEMSDTNDDLRNIEDYNKLRHGSLSQRIFVALTGSDDDEDGCFWDENGELRHRWSPLRLVLAYRRDGSVNIGETIEAWLIVTVMTGIVLTILYLCFALFSPMPIGAGFMTILAFTALITPAVIISVLLVVLFVVLKKRGKLERVSSYGLALVLLVFLHNRFGGARCVYVWTIGLTFIMALINGLETAQVAMPGFEAFLKSWVPLHSYGLGWISFAVVGFVIGLLQKAFTQPKAAA